MKLSLCLAAAALTLSAGAYAQTSQTFNFGEGQSSLPSGGEHRASTQPKAAPKHKSQHAKRRRAHVKQPDTYSHN
ncbi:hypothetical protein LFL96_20830 [Paraburkholderia sp. D15]|uniref:hypothetical protein n=1 Tax=Paraburkholderia sp. D15 TaxID=2880218 RepID=UPI00247A4C81|nr:hypothetical protein [Paraburkholderia sp. D15]WGS53508.1 hypothetical protein LFL96_20830 [Paraburkholderia sp. D15]WKF61034.1 hypothetical protein HUO10_005561 [Paraburkholderia busanensis]